MSAGFPCDHIPKFGDTHSCCLLKGGTYDAHKVNFCPTLADQLKKLKQFKVITKNSYKIGKGYTCYNCGIPGGTYYAHKTEMCPFVLGDQDCFTCASRSHVNRDCPDRGFTGFPLSKRWQCKICDQSGGDPQKSHWPSDCPVAIQARRAKKLLRSVKKTTYPGVGYVCYTCNQEGGDPELSHWRQQCPQPQQQPQQQHIQAQWQAKKTTQPGEGYECHTCGQAGGNPNLSHWREQCPQLEDQPQAQTHLGEQQHVVAANGEWATAQIQKQPKAKVKLCTWCGEKISNHHNPLRCDKRE
jgi:hypothetical protein